MRILLTGATGFIGRRLGRALVLSGHEVIGLTRNVSRAEAATDNSVRYFRWDGLSEDIPQAATQGVQAAIHLAGEPIADRRWTAHQKRRILESRSQGTQRLVDAVNKMAPPPSVVVAISAIGFYGYADATVDEQAPQGAGFLASVCGQWEAPLVGLKQIRSVVIRSGVVLGPESGALVKLLPVFKWGVGGPVGTGRQIMSWVHVDDLVRLFIWAVENTDAKGVYNGTAPEPVTNAEFAKHLGRVLGRPAFFRAPAWIVKLALGEMAEVVLEGTRAVPRRALEQGFKFDHPRLQKALEHLLLPPPDATHDKK